MSYKGFVVTWDYDADAMEMTVHIHKGGFSTFFLIDRDEGWEWKEFCHECKSEVEAHIDTIEKGLEILCPAPKPKVR